MGEDEGRKTTRRRFGRRSVKETRREQDMLSAFETLHGEAWDMLSVESGPPAQTRSNRSESGHLGETGGGGRG